MLSKGGIDVAILQEVSNKRKDSKDGGKERGKRGVSLSTKRENPPRHRMKKGEAS